MVMHHHEPEYHTGILFCYLHGHSQNSFLIALSIPVTGRPDITAMVDYFPEQQTLGNKRSEEGSEQEEEGLFPGYNR